MDNMLKSCVTLSQPTTVSVLNFFCVKSVSNAFGPGLSPPCALSYLKLIPLLYCYIIDHPKMQCPKSITIISFAYLSAGLRRDI